ncbi:MAG: hypothetical protein ACOCQD_02825 [archaeon]
MFEKGPKFIDIQDIINLDPSPSNHSDNTSIKNKISFKTHTIKSNKKESLNLNPVIKQNSLPKKKTTKLNQDDLKGEDIIWL